MKTNTYPFSLIPTFRNVSISIKTKNTVFNDISRYLFYCILKMQLVRIEYKRTEKEEITINARKKDNHRDKIAFIRGIKYMIIENRQE